MKQRRRLEITTFRRRTTVILREGSEVSTGSDSDQVSQTSNVQRPMPQLIKGSEVGTGSGSDRVSLADSTQHQDKENDDELNN